MLSHVNQPILDVDARGELDPDSLRYGRALRRAALPIAIVAICCGLVAALGVGSKSSTTTVDLRLTNPSSSLTSLGLTQTFDELPSGTEATSFLNSLNEAADLDGTLLAVSDPAESTALTLTMTDGDDDDLDQALAELDSWVASRRSGAMKDLQNVITDQRTLTEQRRAQLDETIRSLPASDALREALLDERSDLTTALLYLDNDNLAVAAFTASPERFDVVVQNEASSDSRIVWFIVGAILGLLAVVMVVLIMAHVDRRIRSVGELRAASGIDVCPPIRAPDPSGRSLSPQRAMGSVSKRARQDLPSWRSTDTPSMRQPAFRRRLRAPQS